MIVFVIHTIKIHYIIHLLPRFQMFFFTFKLPAVDLILPPQGSRSRGLKLDELCPPEDNEVEVTS